MSPRKLGVALMVAALAPLASKTAFAQQEVPDEAPAEEAGAVADKPDWTAKPVPALMVTVAARERLLGVAQAGKRLVAVGQQGVILTSEDGKNWKQSPCPVSQMLTRVRFLDDKTGWAVGYDGVILKTADAGGSWVVQHLDSKSRPLYDVLFTDANNGIAVGGYGTWLATTDGGKTWAAQESNPIALLGLHINNLKKLSDGSLFLAGEKGLMARSTDSGATWTMFKPIYVGSIFGVLPLDGNAVMAYGMRGNIFVTDDITKAVTQPVPDPLDYAPEMAADAAAMAALGWKRLENPSKESLFGAMREKGGEVLLVGINGTALRSEMAAGKVTPVKLKADETLVDVLPYGGRMIAVGKRGAQDLGEAK